MSTRQRTASLAAAVLVGALALGACGDDAGPPEDAVQEQVQNAPADAAQARQQAAANAQRLRQVRALYPSAGREVPPDGLVSTAQPAEQAGTTGGSAPLTQPSRTLRHVE